MALLDFKQSDGLVELIGCGIYGIFTGELSELPPTIRQFPCSSWHETANKHV